MNDPWDVKSVRRSEQYVSCMKLNGVPLLPPVLSKECRKEMQYYKLLAKEVEKRICLLKPYVKDSDTESVEDKTDAPDIPPDYENFYDLPKEEIHVNIEKITAITNEKLMKNSTVSLKSCMPDLYDSASANLQEVDTYPLLCPSPKFFIDLSVNINESGQSLLEKTKLQQHDPQPTDPPERDYNNTPKKNNSKNIQKEILTDTETESSSLKRESKKITEDLLSFNIDIDNIILNQSDPFPDMPMEDGPPSLSAKSFTGSLNNIHRESRKDSSKLIRQRSYTVLNPSPQLLAHLKVQSLNTGVDVSCISMSESQTNLTSPKKRRSWDLESAKVKWSSMAMELKHKTVPNVAANGLNRNNLSKTIVRKTRQTSPTPRARSITQDRTRRGSLPNNSQPKSESIVKVKKAHSPVRSIPSNRTIIMEPKSRSTDQKNHHPTHTSSPQAPKLSPSQKLLSESTDPAARVRELYEKIQNQQLIQMANLVEKQKREQMLLQQVFEEQNTILYKQLKTICPKSPIEAKEAWGDKMPQETGDRGPVSLSELINHKSPEKSVESPIASTLTDTRNNINKCDMVLKKSKDITSSIKKHQPRRGSSGAKPQTPKSPDGTRTRTHSPNLRHTAISRRLNYDTSGSDREFEPILTDRTNDTMAGLNVSFPTDSEDPVSYSSKQSRKELTMLHCPVTVEPRSSTDSAIRSMEETIHNSMNTMTARKHQPNYLKVPPTPQQLAAASTIVAYARGYLVRRLMRTERVQATVQTIKDALMCALQLHQDRAGIRGADVDLHRRLIQQAITMGPQITAACYSLHETFVASSAKDRCALIASDRERKRQKPAVTRHFRQKSDIMSQSYSGAFPARPRRASTSLMTQSNYETFSGDKARRYMPSPRRRPWR